MNDVCKGLTDKIGKILGDEITQVEELHSKGNNKILKAVLDSGDSIVIKYYCQDNRNRLEAETRALKYLWDQNLRQIPDPIFSDTELNIAVYPFLSGKKLSSEEISRPDIDQVINFIRDLNFKIQKPDFESIGLASEACFSTKDIVNVIERRLKKLSNVESEINNWISSELVPYFESISQCDESESKKLNQEFYVLSPSDFGFHNIIKSGKDLFFIDFEYFGWDDPAKMICDVLWHTGVPLSVEMRKYFLKEVYNLFPHDESLANRLISYYPLIGFNWILICLNVLMKDFTEKRFGSDVEKKTIDKIMALQYDKAVNLYSRLKLEQKENFNWLKDAIR